METKIFAHRGSSHTAPENTLEAFELAIRQQADGIELDIHLTADGELVVIHDSTLERTTNGTGIVENMTMSELKNLDASKTRPGYKGAKVPTLEEVYDLIKDTNLWINVEIKEESFPNPALAAKVAALEERYGFSERVIYSSFNHYSLVALKSLLPQAHIGLLYKTALYRPWEYAKIPGAAYLHPYWMTCALPALVEEAHKNGVKINAWTVDEPEEIALMLRCGVDGIITNVPDAAYAIRKGE